MNDTSAVSTPRRAAVLFILVTVLLDMLSFGIIIPVLPKLVEEFLSGDTAQAAMIYGLMGTAWAVMQFFGSPIQGALSDRFGRRPIVLLSNLGLGLDYIVMALAPTVAWLFLGRAISGLASSSFSTAGAYIADVTAPEQRAAAFGKIGMVFGLGFILRSCHGRLARRDRSPAAVLGRSGAQSGERLLRVLRVARIPAAGQTDVLHLDAGEPGRLAGAVALAP